ncbi:MAG TPA: helix-turn-helix transcriptional regulator [Anaerolineaceae bacterium]|nr:helix-turn-helix transcriptional regulator [Anaerolineaceae bacterium]
MPRHRRGWAIAESEEERLTPLMGALIEPALLVLLQEQPQHGYTLLANLQKIGMNPPHPSVVYRALREMEFLNWISSDWDADESLGPPRRTYTLTESGRRMLRNWRDEMVRTGDLINILISRIDQQD